MWGKGREEKGCGVELKSREKKSGLDKSEIWQKRKKNKVLISSLLWRSLGFFCDQKVHCTFSSNNWSSGFLFLCLFCGIAA
jgi:hypothetical protein